MLCTSLGRKFEKQHEEHSTYTYKMQQLSGLTAIFRGTLKCQRTACGNQPPQVVGLRSLLFEETLSINLHQLWTEILRKKWNEIARYPE